MQTCTNMERLNLQQSALPTEGIEGGRGVSANRVTNPLLYIPFRHTLSSPGSSYFWTSSRQAATQSGTSHEIVCILTRSPHNRQGLADSHV